VDDDAVALGAAGLRTGALVALSLALLAGAVVWLTREPSILVLYPAFGALWIAGVLLTRRRDTVVLCEDALVVRSRGSERRYPWGDVLELSWRGATWPYFGGGPLARVRGGPWDVPGPNAPAVLATLAVFGQRGRDAAVAALRAAAERHGVPYTDDLAWREGTGRRPRPGGPVTAGTASDGTASEAGSASPDGGLGPSPFATRRSRAREREARRRAEGR
jgi:hypothetical protein